MAAVAAGSTEAAEIAEVAVDQTAEAAKAAEPADHLVGTARSVAVAVAAFDTAFVEQTPEGRRAAASLER